MSSVIEIGRPIPPFTSTTSTGEPFDSESLKGRWSVIYFYPKDNTPGCTQEAIDFEASSREFGELQAVIIGVSRDSDTSHTKFKCKYQLGFELLADTNEALCILFDVIRMKNMYGKHVRGIERSTFMVDPDGILRKEWRKVPVKGHAASVLETLRQLQA